MSCQNFGKAGFFFGGELAFGEFFGRGCFAFAAELDFTGCSKTDTRDFFRFDVYRAFVFEKDVRLGIDGEGARIDVALKETERKSLLGREDCGEDPLREDCSLPCRINFFCL